MAGKRPARRAMSLVDAVDWARTIEPDYADRTASGLYVVVLTFAPTPKSQRDPLWSVGISRESVDEARDYAAGQLALSAVQAGV